MLLSQVELLALARKQLQSIEGVPEAYLQELKKHILLWPDKTDFTIEIEAGRGYGVVTCHENGCHKRVPLVARISSEDGGVSEGVGSLSAYRVHLTAHHSDPESESESESPQRSARVKIEGPKSNANLLSRTTNPLTPMRPLLQARARTSMGSGSPFTTPTTSPTGRDVVKSEPRGHPSLLSDSGALVSCKRPHPAPFPVKLERYDTIDLSQGDEQSGSPIKKARLTIGDAPSTPARSGKPLSQLNHYSSGGLVTTKSPSKPAEDQSDLREEIEDIQHSLNSCNNKLNRASAKKFKAKSDHTRIAKLTEEKRRLKAQKDSLTKRLPTAKTLSRHGSSLAKEDRDPILYGLPSVKREPVDRALAIWPGPEVQASAIASGSNIRLPEPDVKPFFCAPRRVIHAPSTVPMGEDRKPTVKRDPSPMPIASGSKGAGTPPAPAPPGNDFLADVNRYVQGHVPMDYDDGTYDETGAWHGRGRDPFAGPQARADDIDKFLIAAGNAEQFDRNATVDDAVRKLGLPDMFAPLPGMVVALMAHQMIGVAWMIDRERGYSKGGLLADEMGLGKTVQMIATMVANRPTDQRRKATLIIAPLALLDQWQMEVELKTNCGLQCVVYHGSSKPKTRAELMKYDVVLTTYHTLANEYADPEAEVARAKTRAKKKAKAKKREEDQWIVNESTDDSDAKSKPRKKKKGNGLLLNVEWYRVVLDEAQSIRNRMTRVSRAVTFLDAEYRWALTGTPIINCLADAYGYIRFLRIRPWYDWTEFNDHIAKHEKKRATLASSRLQAILATFLVRRKKDTKLDGKPLIELPPKEVQLTKLTFTQEEHEIYKAYETSAQVKFNRFLRAGTVLKNYSHVLVMLLRLRQICSHASLVQEDGRAFVIGDEEDDENLDGDAKAELARARREVSLDFVARMKHKLREIMVERVKAEKESKDATADGDEECSICFDSFTAAVVTPCTHTFCRDCIQNYLELPRAEDPTETIKYKEDERACPECRSAISARKLYSRSAFLPTDEEIELAINPRPTQPTRHPKYERIDSDIEMEIVEDPVDKGKGKGKAIPKRKKKPYYDSEDDGEHSSEDDGLSDFIADEDEDSEDEKAARKRLSKRLGKKRAIVLDSDEEESDDGEVLFGRPSPTMADIPKEQIRMMPRFLPSTKMKHMMELLTDWAEKHPDDKTIVISQWTSCLTLVSDYLTERSVPHVKYQGDMSRTQRDLAVRHFMAKKKSKVMLLSLKCGGVGLNLTRANRVISLDLAWSSAVESQAFDRVHRLGQLKDVFVHRLVIANTVEDRILDIQDRKKNLVDGSLGEGTGKKIGRLSVKELANLFGLNGRGEVIDDD